ncbi:MAG: TetR/AcrR family transcriptional regulator [Alphaproteobacteria bacterium]|nr:TetR/AcrR family transcriptional regulator [Alphaproteobacteria bacterium]
MEKDNIRNMLLKIGRQIVQEKGPEALTARKLSEASGCSVGAIYNQFNNMENFIVIENYLTLEQLSRRLNIVKETQNPYFDMNNLLNTFVDFVLKNKNLWYLLYNFHLRKEKHKYSFAYLRIVGRIVRRLNNLIYRIVPQMEQPERILSSQVLWLTLFALSSLLTKDILDSFSKINRQTLCQIMLNTYIAGLTVLEKKE